jgi:sterol desaturase/sphingolipid hydroxylase (fatty acid hydroxylase superfamily)
MNELWLAAVIFGIIFTLETTFPFILDGRMNKERLSANVSLLVANVFVGLLFGSLTASVLAKNTTIFTGTSTENGYFLRLACLFLFFDGWMYLWHRLNHRVPLFWRFHQVHHSDNRLDTTTTFRFHPGEILLSNFFNLFIFALLGMGPSELLFYKTIFWAVIIFHHSNTAFPLGFDKWLRLIIVTPSLHRVHHSPLRVETDSNYGSIFSFWDRIFNSYRVRDKLTGMVFGLDYLGVNRLLKPKEVFLLPFKRR